jgi:biopolymer transport protein ExbD
MAGVDLGGSKPAGGGGPSWKRPRVKIRIDMTPMVDIAFLLLIFFMVTTVFRMPQAMEMNLPEKQDRPTEVKTYKEKLLTVLVTKIGDKDSLAYMVGTDSPKPLAWDSLRSKLLERRALYGDSLTVLAKIHRDATYSSMVNLVDEFNVAQTTRFSIQRYTTQDDSVLRVVGFTTPGPAGLPTPEATQSDESSGG